jgi:long-chain acyl-CoA synthetase
VSRTAGEYRDDPLAASAFRSVPDMWHHRVGSTPDSAAMVHRGPTGAWETITWREAALHVRDLANGLLSLGLQPEERCAILARTSKAWVVTDMAILCAGGATTAMHYQSMAEECAFILQDCSARVLFCDTAETLAGLAPDRDALVDLEYVVVLQGIAPGAMPVAELEARGRAWAKDNPHAYQDAHRSIAPDRLATLMYTSGTTGQPKGVMLSHDAWVYEAEAIDALGIVTPADVQYLFLPLSHVFAKVMQVTFIRLGVPTYIDWRTDALLPALAEAAPTWMAAVPQVFEQARAAVLREANASGPVARRTFDWALAVGREVSARRLAGDRLPVALRAKLRLAESLVFRKIKQRFGGRIRFFISGGAPLSDETARFFHAIGLLVLEGYGLTESGAASCVNRPDDFQFGTVGPPLPGCEVMVADDGELLLRSRGVMRGYHRLPEETAKALTGDGWLRTGDLGQILRSGHVRITGRKKELIVTAGGKNIAPAGWESRLRSRWPYVAHAMLVGDRRHYCVALVAINIDAVTRWADGRDLPVDDYRALAADPQVRALIQEGIDGVNREVPSWERVRRFDLIPDRPTVESGLLTPTLKLKRDVWSARYGDRIERLYPA